MRRTASRATSSFRGRPRGRLRGTMAPWSKISPPQTPQGSARSRAPARHSIFSGQPSHRAFATSRSAGASANHRSGSYWRHGSSASSPTLGQGASRASGANARVIAGSPLSGLVLVDLVNRAGKTVRPRIPGLRVPRPRGEPVVWVSDRPSSRWDPAGLVDHEPLVRGRRGRTRALGAGADVVVDLADGAGGESVAGQGPPLERPTGYR